MIDLRRNIKRAIEALAIHGSTEYSWFGKRSQVTSLALRRMLSQETMRTLLRVGLQGNLYRNFYCYGIAQPEHMRADLGLDPTGDATFAAALSRANCGRGFWEAGWTALRHDESTIVVTKSGLTICVTRDRAQALDDRKLISDTEMAVHLPKEFFGLSPGFYVAASDMPLDEQDRRSLLRFYWNLQTDGAVGLMALITQSLNQTALPFTFKMANQPTHFRRCDVAVLCVPKRCYPAAVQIVADAYKQIRAHLKPLTPVFTRQLAPGLGFAESPPGGESFGLHRCGILADGIIESRQRGMRTVNTICDVVESYFVREGIDLDRAYLNAGSRDECAEAYPWSIGQLSMLGGRPAGPGGFVETAAEIGQQILSDAFWNGERCNWLGSTTLQVAGEQSSKPVHGMLDSSLYSGTSGVALFLAELYRRTGDAATRRTALAAMELALDFIEADGNPAAMGLYTGWAGIAVAAARTGLILEEDRLIQRVRVLVDRWKNADHDGEFDLLSGASGTIIALIILSELVGDCSLLHLAATLGRSLTRTAERTDAGASWRSLRFPLTRNLTGLSHGTAGVALAMLELFSATGDPEFRQCGEEAFQYEQTWFDRRAQNWYHLREPVIGRRQRFREKQHATSWCHGAPGIALSRLRAYQVIGDARARVEALIAARTTRLWIDTSLATGMGNFSLCHGLAGNAEVMREVFRVIEADESVEGKAAERVAEYGIRTYCQRAWPCGAYGSTPNLMLGLAGIGYFYLGMGGKPPPSVLLLRREEWRRPAPGL